MENESATRTQNYNLTENHIELLAEIAYRERMNKSELIRHLIDAEAKRQGISIGTNGVVVADEGK
jgi:hypothetical protein